MDLDGGPGVTLHQVMKVGLQLLDGEAVRALVPIRGESPNGPGVDIDGTLRLALSAQRAKMLAVECVEFFLLNSVHVEFLQ